MGGGGYLKSTDDQTACGGSSPDLWLEIGGRTNALVPPRSGGSSLE